jgi:hypothetical protein
MIRFLIAGDVVMAAISAWKFKLLPQEVPLFYSKPWGEEQVADIWFILLIPIFMHLLYIANIFLSKRFAKDEPVLQKMFWIGNGIIIFGFTSIFIRIILLVT